MVLERRLTKFYWTMSIFKHGFYFVFLWVLLVVGFMTNFYFWCIYNQPLVYKQKKKTQGIKRKTNRLVQKTPWQDVYYTMSEAGNESCSTKISVCRNSFSLIFCNWLFNQTLEKLDLKKFSLSKVKSLKPATLLKTLSPLFFIDFDFMWRTAIL